MKLAGSVDADVDPVHMDTRRIGRVLNNLISNAIRHTPAQGEVRVEARRTNSGVEVTVSDTGEGIRAEDLPHIFEGFYRGEKSRARATGGAGLGLAISRGIVQAHGGSLRGRERSGTRQPLHVFHPVNKKSRSYPVNMESRSSTSGSSQVELADSVFIP
ncbi:MAG: hypothetical protein HND47_05015 [Chloroflexi bacterium]|nr:hypothetical protein [Chloroflexota bacterium]